jgi:Na+/H+ antiporter NhaD/arsenite permease-like protein
MKGTVKRPERLVGGMHESPASVRERNIIFALGILGLLFVPVFKTVTHLPPFMGMMLSLGVIWLVTEILHKGKAHKTRKELSILGVLRKVDMPSVLFFLGILLGVSALQEVGLLREVATYLDNTVGNIYAINITIGLLSAIVDNVPLVAAAQGMYEIEPSGVFAASGNFWLFLAYCAGTGGSALIIGSAAGVAAMGLERIDFIWYMKKLTWLAVIGYIAGAAVFILMSA